MSVHVCLYVSVGEERRSRVWLQRDVGARRVVRVRVWEEKVCGRVVCMDVLWKSRMREWCEWMCSMTEWYGVLRMEESSIGRIVNAVGVP